MEISKEFLEKVRKYNTAILDESGREILDPKPITLNIRPKQLSLEQRISRLIKTQFSRVAEQQGQETFEEANDFDVQDEFDTEHFHSRFELVEEEFLSPPRQFEAEKEEKLPDKEQSEEKELPEKEDDIAPT